MPPALTPEHLEAVLGADGCLLAALAAGDEAALRITGECMAPDLADGEAVRLDRPGLLLPGDVAAFRCATQDRMVVHRFLGYVRCRGRWKLMTMADRGGRPDPLVDPVNLIGRVKGRSGGPYRVPATKRLAAVGRFVGWCARILCGRVLRRVGARR